VTETDDTGKAMHMKSWGIFL